MSKNMLDIDNLDELFDTEMSVLDNENNEIENIQSKREPITNNTLEKALTQLIENSNSILESAKFLIDSDPDPEAINSAATMINSMTALIAEARKPIMLEQRKKNTEELEYIKTENKLKIEEFKAKHRQNLASLGQGNTFNIQNNNLLPFSQEKIVDMLIEKESHIEVEANVEEIKYEES